MGIDFFNLESPCLNNNIECKNFKKCSDEKLACARFLKYYESITGKIDVNEDIAPRKIYYKRIFKENDIH